MTSLIFWGPYLAHKSVISHKREKQRLKNYERWEGLRDDYDEQRRITRETRSLDINRTGSWDGTTSNQPFPQQQQPTGGNTAYFENDSHPITLRDQQEANDARTSWRPQECWDGPRKQQLVHAQTTGQIQQVVQQPHMPSPQRHVSMTPSMTPQKTGATWDEGLPARLAVSRQSFDGYDHTQRYRPATTVTNSYNNSSGYTQSMPVTRDPSLDRRNSSSLSRQASLNNGSRAQTPSGLRESTPVPAPASTLFDSGIQVTNVIELPKNEFGFVEPARIIAGGRMAELIERGY